jgi:hypothetical protein
MVVVVAGLNRAARDELLVAKAKTQKLAEPQQRQFAVYQVCVVRAGRAVRPQYRSCAKLPPP